MYLFCVLDYRVEPPTVGEPQSAAAVQLCGPSSAAGLARGMDGKNPGAPRVTMNSSGGPYGDALDQSIPVHRRRSNRWVILGRLGALIVLLARDRLIRCGRAGSEHGGLLGRGELARI